MAGLKDAVLHLGDIEEIEVNAFGGQGSVTERLYTGIDPKALDSLAHVLYVGAKKYARDNWRSCPVDEHLNHALRHEFLYLTTARFRESFGNEAEVREAEEEHLSHAFCRLMMALAVHLQGGPKPTGKIPPMKVGNTDAATLRIRKEEQRKR